MFGLTSLYFRGDEAIGERSMCITSASIFFLISMIVLIADENFLEFGLDSAYTSFNQSAHQFLQMHAMTQTTSGPASILLFKFALALWSGIIAGFFTFPCLRFAQMHKDALKYSEAERFLT